MSRLRILDVETVPHPDAHLWVEPVRAKANLKDPVKIAADIAEKEAERDERLGLDPDCCRIVALGYVDVGCGDPIVDLCPTEAEERIALQRFWDSYETIHTRLITFNGFKFDLIVLMMRSLYLGVHYRTLNVDRYRSEHLDLFNRLSFNGARMAHGLQFYAKRFGLPMLDKVHGSEIAALVAAGDWEAVRAHNLSDLGYTHAIANKLGLVEIA